MINIEDPRKVSARSQTVEGSPKSHGRNSQIHSDPHDGPDCQVEISTNPSSPPPPGQVIHLEPFGPPNLPSTRLREILGVGCLVCVMLTTQSQVAQTLLPLKEIAITFGVEDSAGKQSWFAAAFSMSVGTIILPAGRLGDMYGHKRLILLGLLISSTGSLLCGISSYSRSDICFDLFRAWQGVGFSVALPNTSAVLARSSLEGSWRRTIYFILFAASAPNGFLLGALFSSLIAQFHPTLWPFSFYLAAICLSALLVLAWFTIPSDEYLSNFYDQMQNASISTTTTTAAGDSTPLSTAMRNVRDQDNSKHYELTTTTTTPQSQGKPSFDWLGTIFALVGLILVNFAWNQAGVVGWQEPYNGILLGVGIISLAIFLFIESKVQHPLIPVDIWTTQNSIVVACIALGWSSFGTWIFYSLRWWINIRNASLLSATAMTTPVGISGCLAALLSTLLLKKSGPSWTMLSALLSFFLASILIATMPEEQTYWTQSFLSFCIAPFGMDQSFPAASLIIASSLPPNKQGIAGSLVNTVVNWSIAIGLGLSATIDVNTNEGGRDVVKGYRNATFLAAGLAGLGTLLAAGNLLATTFVARHHHRHRTMQMEEVEKNEQRSSEER